MLQLDKIDVRQSAELAARLAQAMRRTGWWQRVYHRETTWGAYGWMAVGSCMVPRSPVAPLVVFVNVPVGKVWFGIENLSTRGDPRDRLVGLWNDPLLEQWTLVRYTPRQVLEGLLELHGLLRDSFEDWRTWESRVLKAMRLAGWSGRAGERVPYPKLARGFAKLKAPESIYDGPYLGAEFAVHAHFYLQQREGRGRRLQFGVATGRTGFNRRGSGAMMVGCPPHYTINVFWA